MNQFDLKALQVLNDGFSTPFYIYDLNKVQSNFEDLEMALGSLCQILFSMKCNPHPQVVQWFSGQKNAMIDVCSIQELKRALQCDFTPDRISFVGPGKTTEEIEFCISQDIGFLVVESLSELKTTIAMTQNKSVKTKILLRVALGETVSISGQTKQNFPSQFGISEDQVMQALEIYKSNKSNSIKLGGLHCFVNSQQLFVDRILRNFSTAIDLHNRIEKHLGEPLPYLNLGGGFGVDYFEGQEPLNLKEFHRQWTELYRQKILSRIDRPKLLVESGRFLTASAGVFYTKVLYRKKSYEKNYAICDGGLTQNLMAIGFGQNVRRNFRIAKVETEENATKSKITLAGPSCYSMDILALDIVLPELREGDLLRLENCGAYGPSFSPQDFLSRPHAKEFIIEKKS